MNLTHINPIRNDRAMRVGSPCALSFWSDKAGSLYAQQEQKKVRSSR